MNEALRYETNKCVEKYMSLRYEDDPVKPINAYAPILDTNNTSLFDDRYFDVCALNLICCSQKDTEDKILSGTAMLIERLGLEGLRHSCVYTFSKCSERMASRLSHGHLPTISDLYTFLIWLEHYDANNFSFWFYRVLLLWASLPDHNENYASDAGRWRALQSTAYSYAFTPYTDYAADRRLDALAIKEPLLRLMHHAYSLHRSMPEHAYITYLTDTLREFSILTLGFIQSRSSSLTIPPISRTFVQDRIKLYQSFIDKNYEQEKKNETVDEGQKSITWDYMDTIKQLKPIVH